MLNNNDSLSTAKPAPEEEAFVNLMRERTFTPELRSLVDKVTGVKNPQAASTGALETPRKLFYGAQNIPRCSAQKLREAAFPVREDSFAETARKTTAFVKRAVESGTDRLVCVGIDKSAANKAEILQAGYSLSLIYGRLKKELKRRAFFIRLRSDFFSVFIRHEDLKNLRDLLDKPDFHMELFYKQEIFFEDRYPADSEMLEIILQP